MAHSRSEQTLKINSDCDRSILTMTTLDSPIDQEPGIQLLVPEHDIADPEVTFVIPAANEEITVSDSVAWCLEGLQRANVVGEVLLVDSSTDRTPALALEGGARVLKVPKRGLGRAYMDAMPFIRGKYIVMGDADCTYDFREIEPFIMKLREGCDFVMGTRMKGTIKTGAMPALHQYFGTPITTWIFNRIYGSRFSDIHCGLRAVTKEALERMGLAAQSWEYASEMILKSVLMDMRTAEVPVTFHKDREGRVSHYKRTGWFTPFYAALISLRIQSVYRAQFFVFKPGLALLAIGLILTLPLSFGSITIGSVSFSLYTMLLGVTLVVLGLNSFFFGCLAQMYSDYSGRVRERWIRTFRFKRTAILTSLLALVGIGLTGNLIVSYFIHGHFPQASSAAAHLGVIGMLFVIVGFLTFGFTLVLHATGVTFGKSSDP
jgi:glycosyltransferase involved in cell wall biosynthesis